MTEEISSTIEVPQTSCESSFNMEIPQSKEGCPNPMRTIFRFKGSEDMAIDLGKLYKIVLKEKEKKVLLQKSSKQDDFADSVEFESEEAALRGYEQIIGVWARGS